MKEIMVNDGIADKIKDILHRKLMVLEGIMLYGICSWAKRLFC